MAAGDFSASVANRVNIELNKLFVNPITQSEFRHPVDTAKALLENQKAISTPVLDAGGTCVGVKAYYVKGATDLATGTPSSTCNLLAGTELESSSQNYSSGVLVVGKPKIDDSLCNNEYDLPTLSALAIKKALSDMRKYLCNTIMIPSLTANAQANLDTGIDTTWNDTTNTPRIDVPEDDFVWEKLGEFRNVAINNDLGDDFLFLTGRNFNADWYNRNYRNITDSRESGASEAFNEYNMYSDIKNLDVTMTRKTTFAVDTGSYFFWNTVINTPTAVQIGENKWIFTMTDPVLMWNKNGVLTPVVYEVEYEKVCTGRDALNSFVYDHTYNIKLIGGFQWAPSGVSSQTGCLEFAALAAE